jgi:hypothetical protein
LAHLYNFRTIQRALEALSPSASPADGSADYEAAFHHAGADALEVVRKKFNRFRPTGAYTSLYTFPGAPELEQILGALPYDTAVVLAWVPTHIDMLALAGTQEDRAMAACRAVYASAASVHGRTKIVDWYVDRPENHNDENYFDSVHYRSAVATRFGEEIAFQLKAEAADEIPLWLSMMR